MPGLKLVERLNEMGVDTLKIVGKKLEISKTATRKADIIEALSHKINYHLADLVRMCTKWERLCLREATYNGGKVPTSQFYGKYGVQCPSPVASYNTYHKPAMSEVSPFPLLVHSEGYSSEICVLEELIPKLKQVLSQPEEATCKTLEQIPAELKQGEDSSGCPILVHSGQASVFDELALMLSLVQARKLRVTDKSKRPTEATVRLVNQSLIEPDFQLLDHDLKSWETPPGAVRAHAWPVLLQQCGWCKAKGSHLELTPKGKGVLKAMDADQIKQGLTRFGNNDLFDELNRITHIKGQAGKGKRCLSKPSRRKNAILDAMTRWPVNQWMAFDDAYRTILAHGHSFSVCRANPWHLYFGEPGYGSMGNEDVGDSLERQYLRALIMESLATLGLVDIAYTTPHGQWPEFGDQWGVDDLSFCSRYDGLMYIRLNDLGAFCLELTDTYQAKATETKSLFKILPTLELALLQHRDLNALDRVRLEQYAVPRSDYVWALNKKHLLERLESGTTTQQVREFLCTYGGNDIPATVETFLNDLDRRTDAVKSSQEALLIEIRDKETAALITHDRVASKYCTLAGSQHVVVPKRHEKPFRKALKNMGYILPQ